jgi:hypothetical protein
VPAPAGTGSPPDPDGRARLVECSVALSDNKQALSDLLSDHYATITSMIKTWINRKSGTCHIDRNCEALEGVPDYALREQEYDGSQHMRWCYRCAVSSPALQGHSGTAPGKVFGTAA